MRVAIDGRIENDDGNTGIDGVLNLPARRALVQRGKRDAVDAEVEHVLDDFVLLGDIRFGEGAVPLQINAELLGGLAGTALDGFPELAARALGNGGEREL